MLFRSAGAGSEMVGIDGGARERGGGRRSGKRNLVRCGMGGRGCGQGWREKRDIGKRKRERKRKERKKRKAGEEREKEEVGG